MHFFWLHRHAASLCWFKVLLARRTKIRWPMVTADMLCLALLSCRFPCLPLRVLDFDLLMHRFPRCQAGWQAAWHWLLCWDAQESFETSNQPNLRSREAMCKCRPVPVGCIDVSSCLNVHLSSMMCGPFDHVFESSSVVRSITNHKPTGQGWPRVHFLEQIPRSALRRRRNKEIQPYCALPNVCFGAETVLLHDSGWWPSCFTATSFERNHLAENLS